MQISKKEVEDVAMLSRLHLDENTTKEMQEKISDILSFMDKLNEIDTADTEPTSHILDLVNVVREDIVKQSIPVKTILDLAPEKKDNFIVVPRVI